MIDRLIPAETVVVMVAADAQMDSAIVAFRTVNIMDVTMVVTDEANPKSEAPVKVTSTHGNMSAIFCWQEDAFAKKSFAKWRHGNC